MNPLNNSSKNRYHLVLAATLVATLLLFPNAKGLGQSVASPPPAKILQTGDLIWPKKPGAIVPYNSRPGEANDSDAQRWRIEKETYLTELRKKPAPTAEERARYTTLQKMTYQEFLATYLDAQTPGEASTFGAGGISVGHVGVIEIVDEGCTVVEAMVKPGVRRVSYAQWLHDRPGELIWVGRLKGISADKRIAVARIAASYIGRPYDFWNFNLKDDSGFYCSKLAWLSILSGAGFPPDDNPNPKRILWYSPKQLMHSRHVELIVNPGSYGSKRIDR